MKIVLLLLVWNVYSQSCLSSTGTEVDWWFILKMPTDSSIPYQGFEYYYCDSQTDCSQMIMMSDELGDSTTALQRTVAQIKFTSTSTMNVVWNDQPFGKSSISDRAHSKGMLSASTSGLGFVINHSTPNFPVFDSSESEIIGGMPSTSSVYGQHYFCVSMTTTEINKLAAQYITAQTITQKSNPISSFQSSYPNIYALKDNSRTVTAQSGSVTIKSRAGLSITAISINQALVEDFYAQVVAPTLKTGVVMETWGNGTGGLQAAECTNTYHTYSSLYRNHNGYKFKYTKDHSKYGISIQSSLPYVCMSDLNRQTTQNKRGGTSLCFLHSKIWNLINQSFIERQSC